MQEFIIINETGTNNLKKSVDYEKNLSTNNHFSFNRL